MNPTRNLWPYGIIAAFVLFFFGTVGLIIIATTHRDNLVSGDYYEREIQYQNHIDGAARARQAGASLNFHAAARRIAVSVPVAQTGQNFSGQIELYRPSAPGLDCQFKLRPDATGGQTVADLPAGPWEVRVAWNAGGRDYYLDRKIIIPAK